MAVECFSLKHGSKKVGFDIYFLFFHLFKKGEMSFCHANSFNLGLLGFWCCSHDDSSIERALEDPPYCLLLFLVRLSVVFSTQQQKEISMHAPKRPGWDDVHCS